MPGTRRSSGILAGDFILYVPLALVAAYAGIAVFRRVTSRQFNVTVYVLLIGSGVSLMGGLL